MKGVRPVARCNPLKTATYAVRKIPAVFQSRRVLPVALVHPVAGVSPGVDMLAASWVASVSPVLAMRWFSFVQ
jgi:hypothetical protein